MSDLIKYPSPLDELPRNWLQCFGNNKERCNKTYDSTEIRYNCDCSTKELLEVKIDLNPHKEISQEEWRNILKKRAENIYKLGGKNIGIWQEFLPISDLNDIVSLSEGWTPIDSLDKIAEMVGMDKLYGKSLGLNQTLSFKDYGQSEGITKANELYRIGSLKKRAVACASTGNTSSSLVAYAARAGFDCYIFIGEGASKAKIFQTAFLGPKMIEIIGGFDPAMNAALELSKAGYFYLLNSINPYRIEGQKAISMETMVQMDFDVDCIVVPLGNAGNSAAITKALREWEEIGIIDELPRVYGIQAKGADPVARKFETGKYKAIKEPKTNASAIEIGNPVSGEKAELGIKATGGIVISVPDEEIFKWQKLLAENEGIEWEPASSTTLAGVYELTNIIGEIDKKEKTVCMGTGHLLKDTKSPLKYNPDLLKIPKVKGEKNDILNALGLS